SADITTARAESYIKPGALPWVRPGTLKDDLARRDFTVNAMAIEINPRHYGELIDPHGGRQDLRDRAIRVLHEKSFTDDATRIWRAVRYEQRLDFTIEPMTLLLLERDLPMLSTITGTRIRHELELVLREAEPEKALRRAADLGVLEQLHPSLALDAEQAGQFSLARERYAGNGALPLVYMALLCAGLDAAETETLIACLHPTRPVVQVLRETAALKDRGIELANHGPAPSQVYASLHGYSLPTLMAAALGNDAVTAEQIELYLNVLRHVKPALGGGDLKKLGVPEGPQMKEVLQALREARLDGKISTKAEEEQMVREMS
ncbi:MAG: hypothetical protein MUO19_06845, partial [Dehalococcoidales bacterium]|nr:hypothetical protein [Dehalococcoidales bacterium]